MKFKTTVRAVRHLLWAVFFIPVHTPAQCELLKRDIEDIRTHAMELLKISDTLEVFAANVSTTPNYRTARSNARRAQIYSGEVLAAAYQVESRAAGAQQRAETCGMQGVGEYLSLAGDHASQAKHLADQAFEYSKRAYSARSLSTMKGHLEKSISAVQEARKAASSVAAAASEAHFCCSADDVAVAGRSR